MNKIVAIIFLLSFSGFVFAQNDPLEKQISLQFQEESFENVLALITEQTGVRFSYNSQLVNPKEKVTINIQDETITEILPIILPSTTSYKKVGEHIVFYAKKEEREKGEKEERRREKEEISPSNFEGVSREARRGSLYEEKVADGGSPPDDGRGEEKSEKNTPASNGTPTDSCHTTVSLTKNDEMKSQIAGLLLAAATATMPIAAQDTQKTEPVQNIEIQQQEGVACKPFQLTFFYPLGTGFVKTAENCYHASINILGGVTGQTKGFEMGGLFNVNKYGATGAQFAGLFNLALANNQKPFSSANAQFAGICNVTKKGKSVQFAGICNIGDTAYFQSGGIFNVAKEAGFQAAGIFNVANRAGFQAGGIFNVAKEVGGQAGGIFNIADKTIFQAAGVFNQGGTAHVQAAGIWNAAKETKCQLAGVANVAQESVCQISGLVNVTKKGRFQMGLINVRDTADGISFGLINIVKKGGVLEAGIEAGEFVHTALTFRSGVKYLYSILFVGYNYTENYWSWGAGLGTSIKLVGNLSLNLEVTERTIFQNVSRFPMAQLVQFNPVLNYRFAKHFKIYAGPSINFLFQHHSHYLGDFDPAKIRQIKIPYSLYHYSTSSSMSSAIFDIWIGVVGGIKF